ncbi:shikimate kinase [Bartonella bacilliformis]|uniref:shikimate kinase n=1 Tax=Bartonella bacilliformis TaxID=774 RepID=UPI00044B73BC|nr:shikimate kinase [Bartonella bacilliformis]EYS95527.1 hypothetical protein X470_00116 [Bartonella bacilliformis Peru-18]KEG18396.1 hypothetical protein H709_00038 [Bartonella bacilliformis CUSCO5]KEG24718.1 hypothetical protein H703_00038 [Bartonella bacilliformis Ver075]KZM38226.1 shikimate kinase [Bartonella bacilliformis]
MKNNRPHPILETHIKSELLSCFNQQALVFVGFMGSGKSAIGKRVATMLDMPFYDSDQEIEKAAQMTISDLFEIYGESEFRLLEQRVILNILKNGPLVLATGGGAYMNENIRKAIHHKGISIWLKTDFNLLIKRVSQRLTRPLLQTDNPQETIRTLMEKRYPIYATANLMVKNHKESRNMVAKKVIKRVQNYINDRNKRHESQNHHGQT